MTFGVRARAARGALAILLSGGLFAARPAAAEGPGAGPKRAHGATSDEKDAEAYCRWVKAIAAANADVMVAPSVYATGGYVSSADISAGASNAPPTGRLIIAGLYSFGGLNRGLATISQADAECRRYRADAKLHAYIERNRDAVSVPALTAKVKVLDAAMPKGEEILAQERALLTQSRMTVDDVAGTQLRLDTLRQIDADAHQQMAALASAPPTPHKSIRQAVAERDEAEVEVEREDGRIRASQGWDLALRGGYDHLFGVADTTPVFAMATLTVSLGWFFVGSANSDAQQARRDWVRAQVEGDDDRVEQVVTRLRSVREEEQGRLRQNNVLLADLESRYRAVSAMTGDKARSFADVIWFDLVRVQSEHAYFSEHVRELDELIGDEGNGGE
jgi:hypothetical protein